jgi:UDP-N-acetylglucosamine 2-epimerase (non-hydrolysing)
MPKSTKVLLSIGTRPEVIKMAPIYYELVRQGLTPVLLHTGQHTDMASTLYNLFGIIPDYNLISRPLNVLREQSNNKTFCDLSTQSSNLLQNISNTIMEVDPEIVMVHGDTSSALMSALAAFYQKRKIAHVEAGLRSNNEYDPFPEEKNRVLIGQLAKWHFAPTSRAKNNLLAEGVPDHKIHVVGNTVVDAALLGVEKINSALIEAEKPENNNSENSEAENYDLIHKIKSQISGKTLLMVTVHRRENHGKNIASIAKAVLQILQENKDFIVVWPVHPNPKVKDTVYYAFENVSADIMSRLYLTEPLNYPILLWIMKNSWLILTDSGGIQEESVALNTPALVLRETTERPEIIEAGAGILVGTDGKNIIAQVDRLKNNKDVYKSMCNVKNPFGDGTTAKSICEIILRENLAEKKYA